VLKLTPTLAAADPLEHVVPHNLHEEPLFSVQLLSENTNSEILSRMGIEDGRLDFYITNHMLMTLVAAVVVGLAFAFLARRMRIRGDGVDAYVTRGRFAQLLETITVFIREEVVRPNLGHLTDKYIGYIWTVFFLILFANLLGLIPIGYFLVAVTGGSAPALSHWGGTATSNLALNGMLALCSFIMVIFVGIREAGAKNFVNHFNPVGWSLAMLPVGLLLFVLEWLGLVIKCIVLAMRLFGTMMAGHLVIAAFVGLIFASAGVSTLLGYGVGIAVVFGGAALLLLELFIALLQAFIFTFLTVLFIASGAVHEHEHEEEHEREVSPEPEAGSGIVGAGGGAAI